MYNGFSAFVSNSLERFFFGFDMTASAVELGSAVVYTAVQCSAV